MDINRANIEVFFTSLQTAFNDAFVDADASARWRQFAMTLPSSTSTEEHGWVNQLPGMRPWIGSRQAQNVQSASLTVKNRKYEGTIEIPREDLEDDKEAIYRNIRAPGLGRIAANYPEEIVLEALLGGTSDEWADGTAFFSDSRTFGSVTIDNYTTASLGDTAFNAAFAAMTSYRGHNGRPLNVMPMALLFGPSLRTTAFELLADDFRARSADASTIVQGQNANKGLVAPVMCPYLVDGISFTDPVTGEDTTYANAGSYWFLLGEVGGVRGCVYQDRVAAEIQDARTRVDSDFVFENDKFQFGARMRGAGFLSLPQLIVGNFATS